MDIVILTGPELLRFLEYVESVHDMAREGNLDILRVGMDAGGVKLKANFGTWSPGLGEKDE